MPDGNSKNESLPAKAVDVVETIATVAIGVIGLIFVIAGGGTSKERN